MRERVRLGGVASASEGGSYFVKYSGGKCIGRTMAGRRCEAFAMTGSKFCFFHHPDTRAEREAARRAGGRKRARPVAVLPAETPDWALLTIADLTRLVGDIINRTVRGELDSSIAYAVGYLANTQAKLLERRSRGGNLAALERTVAQMQEQAFGAEDPESALMPEPGPDPDKD
jgi:hypothetical protein